MNKLNILIVGLVGLMFLGACSDYLNEKSQDEVIVKTVSDFSEFLLGSGYPDRINTTNWVLYLLDDDAEINENAFRDDRENSSIMERFGYFTWQPDMWERKAPTTESYSAIYSRIMGVNATLDYIDEAIAGTTEEREQVKAEALGLRGYFYFMLVNMYGEPYHYNKKALAIPLKLVSDMEENGMRRNTVEEVYDQIVNDLRESSDLFEKYPKRRGNYRINNAAVNILLSRTYLHMELWDSVIVSANEAIRDAEGLMDYTKRSSSFVFLSYDNPEIEWLYGGSADYLYALEQNGFRPSDDLISSFDSNDCRLDLWFSTNKLQVIKKTGIGYSVSPKNTLRISEAYLNRAEAYVFLGKLDEALADLNELRRNRIVDYQDVNILDPTLLLSEIRQERRLELCYDELRWFDLRRCGMPSISHLYKSRKTDQWVKYTLRAEDPLYTLPIANTVIDRNLGLVQNVSANEPVRQGDAE